MIAWSLIYAAAIALLGQALALAIVRKNRPPIIDLIAPSLALGAGAMGLLLLWISMLGVPPNRVIILILGMTSLGWIIFSYVTRAFSPCLGTPHGLKARVTWIPLVLVILLSIAANLLMWIPAIGMPLFEWDSFVIWGLKSKVLFHSALSPRPDYFTDVRFSFSHLAYPLLHPMLVAGAYTMMGEANDQWGKIALPILFAGQSLLGYLGARIWLRPLPATAISLLMIGAPFNVEFAGNGTADMALATFRLGSIVYLIRWVSRRERPDLIFASLFTLFTAMTKSEGLPLAGIHVVIVAIVAVRSSKWKSLAPFAAIVIIGIAIWLFWKIGIPQTDEAYASRLNPATLAAGLERIPTIFTGLFKGLADTDLWGTIWMLVLLFAGLGFMAFRQAPTIVLWTLFLSQIGLYVVAYMITPWNVSELMGVTLPRLTLHLLPAGMMLIAAHGSVIFEGGGQVADQSIVPGENATKGA